MTQPQIKDSIARLPWVIQLGTKVVTDDYNNELLVCDAEEYSSTTDIANQQAICHAVNNTYGNGINPEKVEEMHDMLKTLWDRGFEKSETGRFEISVSPAQYELFAKLINSIEL